MSIDQLGKKFALAATVAGLIGSAYGAFTFINGKTESVVTNAELDLHDKNEKAHPFILQSIKEYDIKVSAAEKAVEEARESQVALGARLVRMLATEQEPNKALKAAAANYYEDEYKRLIRKGATVEEAMLDSLRQPFYTRPRQF